MDFIKEYALVIISLALSLILVVIVVSDSFQKGKVFKTKLMLSLVNVFVSALAGLAYKKYISSNEILTIIYFSYVILLIICFFAVAIFVISYSNQKAHNYQQFIDSLNNTHWNVYFMCDKKERIKEISDSLLQDIGLTKNEVIGKKAFDIFDQKIRFTHVNDTEITNKEFREYYRTFPLNAKENEEYKREIYFQNCNGQTVVLNVVEKPIFISSRYSGRLCVGQKKSDESLVKVEKELVDRNQDLESIQYKFIAALELTEEGIFFNDLDQNYIWGNDVLVADLKLGSNTISSLGYRDLINPEDLSLYNNALKNLTPERPTYSITYRLKIGNRYEFVKEVGKRIFEDENSNVILGFAKKINANYFEKTNFAEIDSVKSFDELALDLEALFKDHRLFQLVCINLTTLPEINERCGRKVGNMVMNEYIKKIKNNFLTESSDIYRASGLVFYFTITDNRKMEFFRRGLSSDASSLNLTMNYGSIKAELKVNIGVSEANTDGLNKDELIRNCNKAINTSLNPNYRLNYVYYKDIKDTIR